jgi:TonB family protein
MLENPFLYSLAITLIHFIWQGCLVALVLKLIFTFISPQKTQLRYTASAIAMLISLVIPLITFFIVYQVDFEKLTNNNETIIGLVNNITQSKESDFSVNLIEYMPFLSLAWLASISYLAIKLIFDIYYVKQLTQTNAIPAKQVLQKRFTELANNMHLWRMPQLLISAKAEIPMAVGWLKPVILLPINMISGLTNAQLEMLLLHELAHIKRHDYLINFLQTLIEILLFFHPAIRWVSTQMRNEREFCSDDIAVVQCCKPIAYARTLAETAALCQKHQYSIPQMALAASGGDLKQRVIRLVDSHCTSSNDFGKWLAGIFIILSIIGLSTRSMLNLPTLEDKLAYLPFYSNSATPNYKASTLVDPINLSQTPIAQHLLNKTKQNPNNNNAINSNNTLTSTNISVATKQRTNLLESKATVLKQKNTSIQRQPQQSTVTKDVTAILVTAKNKNTQSTNMPLVEEKLTPIIINNEEISHSLTTASKTNSTNKTINFLTKQKSKITLENKTNEINNLNGQHLLPASNTKNTNSINLLNKKVFNKNVAVNKTINKPVFNTKTLHLGKHRDVDVVKQFNIPTNPYAAQLAELAQPYNDKNTINKDLENKSAQLISSFAPKYPQIAKRKKIELELLVHFTVDINGYVKDIRFEQQNKASYFRRSIRAAMRKWRFKPAEIKGKKVPSKMSKIFSFYLTD